MARNSLYPGFVRINYHANGHRHSLVQPVSPALVAGVWTLNKPDGGSYNPWTLGVTAFVTIMKAIYDPAAVIDNAELFTLASPTASPVFEDAVTLNISGTEAAAPVPWGQLVFTLRLAGGGIMRPYFMESTVPVDQRIAPGSWAADFAGNGAFYLTSANYVWGRELAAPIVGIWATSKTNDELRRKDFLDL